MKWVDYGDWQMYQIKDRAACLRVFRTGPVNRWFFRLSFNCAGLEYTANSHIYKSAHGAKIAATKHFNKIRTIVDVSERSRQ